MKGRCEHVRVRGHERTQYLRFVKKNDCAAVPPDGTANESLRRLYTTRYAASIDGAHR